MCNICLLSFVDFVPRLFNRSMKVGGWANVMENLDYFLPITYKFKNKLAQKRKVPNHF